VDVIIPSAAPAVFTALAYANLQTGHLEEARGHLTTARQYAKAQQLTALTGIEGLIEARAKSRFAPKPGERVQRVEGLAEGLECRGAEAKLKVVVDGQSMRFEMPEPKAVEFSRPHGNTAQLACQAPAQPFPIVVDYVAPNIVRRVEF
jgi:hypothetical protein